MGTYENDDMKVGIGRFDPYILFREKYMSIRKPEDVLTMTLDSAIELIKNRRERKPPAEKK